MLIKGCKLKCIISPLVLGVIEVYPYFSDIKTYALSKLKSLNESDNEREHLITDTNIDYFVCRDVIVDVICKTRIMGIENIKKMYPREEKDTHQYIADTDGSNF